MVVDGHIVTVLHFVINLFVPVLMVALSILNLDIVLLGPSIFFSHVICNLLPFDLNACIIPIEMDGINVSPHLCNVGIGGTIPKFGSTGSIGSPGRININYTFSRECFITRAPTSLSIISDNFTIFFMSTFQQALLDSGKISIVTDPVAFNLSCFWIQTLAYWDRL